MKYQVLDVASAMNAATWEAKLNQIAAKGWTLRFIVPITGGFRAVFDRSDGARGSGAEDDVT